MLKLNAAFTQKTIQILSIALPLLLSASVFAAEKFDHTRPGNLPNKWISGVTGKGSYNWAVVKDKTAPSQPHALKQSAIGDFPWCVKSDVALRDGFVKTKFKSVSGKKDQAGGLVWRWKDGKNYYVARANALENNVSLYYVKKGKRRTIKYKRAPVPLNVWHTLRVEFEGNMIRVLLNGIKYIDLKNDQLSEAGAVGLWTKADSVTMFDDFSYGSE